ncbi:MAG TPA: 50S ribosomal protein L4 [Nitrososphaeraceae archaeon]
MTTKSAVMSVDGKIHNDVQLPEIFDTPFRPEVIHKVYVNLLSHLFQKQGRYPAAGELVSAESRNTGLGIARLARIRGEGFSRAGQAAGVAGVRHGRVAHPPESSKRIYKKINKKEKRLGLCSAIAATAHRDLIESRGHNVKNISSFPIIVSNEFESISKTQDLQKALIALGLGEDLMRSKRSTRRSRAQKTGARRKKSSGISALAIVSNSSTVRRLSNSIPGVDIRSVESLSVLDLAPGSKPIRLTIFSEAALQYLDRLTTHIQGKKFGESVE